MTGGKASKSSDLDLVNGKLKETEWLTQYCTVQNLSLDSTKPRPQLMLDIIALCTAMATIIMALKLLPVSTIEILRIDSSDTQRNATQRWHLRRCRIYLAELDTHFERNMPFVPTIKFLDNVGPCILR